MSRNADYNFTKVPQDRGTFRNSWTWFDISIVHDHQKKLSSDNNDGSLFERIYSSQRNKHAGPEWASYRIQFEKGHQLFADLQEGDVVVLWAKASFPGWTNYVREANVELWCEDDLEGCKIY